MSVEKEDNLLELWLSQRTNASKTAAETAPKSAEERLNAFLTADEKTREKLQRQNTKPVPPQPKPAAYKSSPLLSGRLAEHLSEQEKRILSAEQPPFHSESAPFELSTPDSRAAAATSLVLCSHLIRFAGSEIPEQTIVELRDSILRTFDAREAVRIEVEAYDLLNWFAGAMNPDWRMRQAEPVSVQSNAAETTLNEVIERAIANHIDLDMRYYTGSRSEFSERSITPIAISAEKYLIAFCHMRQEERVFRLSRIVHLSPAQNSIENSSTVNPALYSYPAVRTGHTVPQNTESETVPPKQPNNLIDSADDEIADHLMPIHHDNKDTPNHANTAKETSHHRTPNPQHAKTIKKDTAQKSLFDLMNDDSN